MNITIFKNAKPYKFLLFLGLFLLFPVFSFASGGQMPTIGSIRLEFILFGLTLAGVALFHKQTFWVAVTGLTVIMLYKFIFDPHFHFLEHLIGETPFMEQLFDKEASRGEWSIILNLAGLLIGFAILSKIFEESGVPDILPNYLPDDWKGPFMLLVMVFFLSAFLDNIAGALIGGTIALVVFKNKVHIGYIAAIVAASNAGGSGSVVGDTTTTMMWIDGVSALNVLHAYIAAFVTLLIIAWYGAHQQDKFQRIQKDATIGVNVDYMKLLIVGLMLVGAIVSNIMFDMPALGVWVAIGIGAFIRKMPWHEISASLKGTIFLLCLVTAASLMPVEELPEASWMTAFILGFVSAVFDNIPLTKLCLDQGHYDWGMLAYTVGFGGSMVWFGSSAGVAITNKFPEARNVGLWIRKGWHIILAYIAGFFFLYIIWGWEPGDNKKHKVENCPVEGCQFNPNTIKAPTDTIPKTYEIKD
jgi:Na+/H+ antiporter NhaD/arsenite permease-like protein